MTHRTFSRRKQKKVIGGNIEKEAFEEMEEVSEFSKKAKAEKDMFKANTDANYFTVVTFNNSDQLTEFLNKIGISQSDNQYIDGAVLAKKLGIEITTPNRKAPGAFKVNHGLTDLII